MFIVGTRNTDCGIMAGLAVLQAGGSSEDAVESVLRAVEDRQDDRSVGPGGLPNLLGYVEQDASIVDGHDLRAGCVGALRGYRHPISVARKVMDLLPHVFLVGEGAGRFASEVGAETCPAVSAEAYAEYERWIEGAGIASDLSAPASTRPLRDLLWQSVRYHPGGTSNVIAVDDEGHICCGVTTSGWAYKYPGRLGDSPVVGAGNYADDRYGAAACTGLGEATIRLCTAHAVVLRLAMGQDLDAALAGSVSDLLRLEVPIPFGVSILAVDAAGNHALQSTSPKAGPYLAAYPGDELPRELPATIVPR